VACYGQWIAPSNTGTVVINILNMETIANGNDYGIDDISFTYIPVSKLYYIVLYCIVLYCIVHHTVLLFISSIAYRYYRYYWYYPCYIE